MEKSNIIKELTDRIANLEKRLKGNKDKKAPKEDEEVCPKCGGDLLFVEEGIVYCSKCKEFYEDKKEEDE